MRTSLVLAVLGTTLLLPGTGATIAAAQTRSDATTSTDTLVVVNGEPITGADIDAMIMSSHQNLDMSQETNALLSRLIEKAINDRLILQDAAEMGLQDDPEVLGPVTESSVQREIALFVRDTFHAPDEVSEQEIAEFFEAEYHRIHLRQISVRTREEMDVVLKRLRRGDDMDAIARALSLDTKRLEGGLHNFKHWIDVEPAMQRVTEGLAVGALSEPFKVNDAWAVLRVEDRRGPDRAELPEYEAFIRSQIIKEKQKAAWFAFVDGLEARSPLQKDEAVLASIRADGDKLFHSDFLVQRDVPALWIDPTHVITETALRSAVSRAAMERGDETIDAILDVTIAQQREKLVLQYHSEKGGYAERPEIVAAFDRELEELMLKTYLNETVVSKIRFNDDELEAFYEEHKDDFRGPEEVRLGFIFFDELDAAEAAAQRLHEGADWNYVRREIEGPNSGGEETKFAPLNLFSDAIIAAIEPMAVGATSDPVSFNGRWMVLRLEGRKHGEPQSRDEVEMPIRNAVFQQKFRSYLDDQLDRLKARSTIVRHEDRIRRYLQTES